MFRNSGVIDGESLNGIVRAIVEATAEIGLRISREPRDLFTYLESGTTGAARPDGTAPVVWTTDPEIKRKKMIEALQALRRASNGLRLSALMVDDLVDALKKAEP